MSSSAAKGATCCPGGGSMSWPISASSRQSRFRRRLGHRPAGGGGVPGGPGRSGLPGLHATSSTCCGRSRRSSSCFPWSSSRRKRAVMRVRQPTAGPAAGLHLRAGRRGVDRTRSSRASPRCRFIQAVLESLASEHAARMVAMQNATAERHRAGSARCTWSTTRPASRRSPATCWISPAAPKRWPRQSRRPRK